MIDLSKKAREKRAWYSIAESILNIEQIVSFNSIQDFFENLGNFEEDARCIFKKLKYFPKKEKKFLLRDKSGELEAEALKYLIPLRKTKIERTISRLDYGQTLDHLEGYYLQEKNLFYVSEVKIFNSTKQKIKFPFLQKFSLCLI